MDIWIKRCVVTLALAVVGLLSAEEAPTAPFVKCTSPKYHFQVAPCPPASRMELVTSTGSTRKIYPPPADAVDRVRRQLLHGLKDPDSVQYDNIRAVGLTEHPSTWAICGSFNARNAYGGYVGYRRFVLIGESDFYPESSLGFDVMYSAWCRTD
jgi:hypothetical protein